MGALSQIDLTLSFSHAFCSTASSVSPNTIAKLARSAESQHQSARSGVLPSRRPPVRLSTLAVVHATSKLDTASDPSVTRVCSLAS